MGDIFDLSVIRDKFFIFAEKFSMVEQVFSSAGRLFHKRGVWWKKDEMCPLMAGKDLKNSPPCLVTLLFKGILSRGRSKRFSFDF